MASDVRPEGRRNRDDSVFAGLPVGKEEPALFAAFLAGHDFSANSRRAFTQAIRTFADESLNTTARYTKRSGQQLADAAERLTY